MFTWFSYLKEFNIFILLGAVSFATLALLWLYKRRQSLRRAQIEGNISQQGLFLRNGIVGLVISLLLFSLFCCVEILSSASVVTILGTLSFSLVGAFLLSGFLILGERSKWYDRP